MIQIPHLLDIAKEAALLAGQAILAIYESSNFDISMKPDDSPLTLADKTAHSIITSTLEKTGIPILSEEGRNIPYAERKHWEWFWLVDPLDGTKEFINRNGEFTVNIALINKQAPIAGVIYAPFLNKLYYGSPESGAHRIMHQVTEKLPVVAAHLTLDSLKNQDIITVVASKSHNNEATTQFISQFQNTQLRSVGSSIKLMLVAEGNADIYPRLAPTMEWDIAAGHAILKSVNKGVYHTNFKTELLYNKEELLNPAFVAL